MGHAIDEDVTLRCIDCGAAISEDVDRSFAVGAALALCFACAEERGGIYDAIDDRWVLPPDVAEQPDEQWP